MKLGILGGTFDPPHKGHIEIARVVKEELGLDTVIFMVAGNPRMKGDSKITPVKERVHMVSLAVQDEDGFTVSTLEAERPGTTYTAETIKELQSKAMPGDELYFILGWDNLLKFKYWHKPGEIIKNCFLAAVPRPGAEKPVMEQLEKDVPGISKRTVLLDVPLIDISASEIRERIIKDQQISGLVPENVAEYIRMKGLYR